MRIDAHRAGGQNPGLPGVHHSVGNVEYDNKPSSEGRNRDLTEVAESEK